MINKLDAALSFHQNALRIRSERQGIIAANIANADTPNYKARDIDFDSAMKDAIAGVSAEKFAAKKTDEKHMDGLPSNIPHGQSGDLLYRKMLQGSVDGNTVDMDIERNQFVDNAIRYEASLTMINGQLKKMLTAIQGQ